MKVTHDWVPLALATKVPEQAGAAGAVVAPTIDGACITQFNIRLGKENATGHQ